MKNCIECGRLVDDDKECPKCAGSPIHSGDQSMRFDPMHEVLLLHEKMDKMGANLDVINERIQSLAIASLNHSQVFLGVLQALNEMSSAIEILANTKNKPN
jgi:hypothetical protein